MSARGQSLIEVTAGLVVLAPVVVVLIDLAVIMYGVQLNDSACHNAVQAAACGVPDEARSRAQAVIDQVNSRAGGRLVSNFAIQGPVQTKIVAGPVLYHDHVTGMMLNPGGLIVGTVTLTTTVDVRPFIVYHIYGGRLPLRFSCQQSFPIRCVLPATVPPQS